MSWRSVTRRHESPLLDLLIDGFFLLLSLGLLTSDRVLLGAVGLAVTLAMIVFQLWERRAVEKARARRAAR